MTLSPGTRLGPYEITASIGAGGMGEVYKARDARLDRSVAIKVLPPEASADPDRRARFEREAKAISQINHPYICTLHDVGRERETVFLVMELLEGETLAAWLEKGPLSLEETLRIGSEIAAALDAAHRHGVVHRDLKPANVMLVRAVGTRSGVGTTKLLDFGLAKLRTGGPIGFEATAAPTGLARATVEGTLLGTLPYMAPEQVEGREADARTDIWALGCVLYEMAAGRRAFASESQASLIGAIMASEPPPLTATQPLTPPAFDRLVRTCLAKDPDERWQSAGDVRRQLQWLREGSSVGAGMATTGLRLGPGARTALAAALVVVGLVLGTGVTWLFRPASPAVSILRPSLDVRPAEELDSGGVGDTAQNFVPIQPLTRGGARTALTWTADGRALVFAGRAAGVQQLYVRHLDAVQAVPIEGTTDAQMPVVSPDGRWLAFWADGSIKKRPVDGGPVVPVLSSAGLKIPPYGLAWGADETLFFGKNDGRIWKVSAEGMESPVTTLAEDELAHTLPSLLPDGRTLLYTVRRRVWTWGDDEVVAQQLGASARKVLLKDAVDARYVPATGHLVFLRRGQLFAVRFDTAQLKVQGRPEPVLDQVVQALTGLDTSDISGAGQFAVSSAGTLAWVSGPVGEFPELELVTVSRTGVVSPIPDAPAGRFAWSVRVSPNGKRLAVPIMTLKEVGLWVWNLEHGGWSNLTRDGEASCPVWDPTGKTVLFQWLSGGRHALAAQAADRQGGKPTVEAYEKFIAPSSFAGKDANTLVGVRDQPGWDLIVARRQNGKAAIETLWTTPEAEWFPDVHPNGQILAYGTTDTEGRQQIRVRSFPVAGWERQVSIDGGWSAAWNPNGRELFFNSLPDATGRIRMMAVDFGPGAPPTVGRPRELFTFSEHDVPLSCWPIRCFDVAPGGDRFYGFRFLPRAPRVPVTHVNLAPDFFEMLKAKVPVKR